MKIAICLAGQLRTGLDSLPNLLNYIGDLLPNCDFFIHTWDVETYSSEGFSCNRYDEIELAPYGVLPVDKELIYEYVKKLNPKIFILGNYKQWEEMDYRPSHDPHLYSVRQANELKIQYEKENNFKYSVVLRTRPDLICDPKKSLKDDIAQLDLHNNQRTFCYAQCFDSTVYANKIDNAFWLGSSYVMDQLSNFELIRGNTHHDFPVDGFMHFGNWVTLGLGFNVKKLQNSRIAIYREYHKDLEKDCVKDFETIFKMVTRPVK